MDIKPGEKIRELRKIKHLTLRDLAERLKIDFTYLSKIENMTIDDKGNPTIPSRKLIINIAEALGSDPDELLLLYKKIPTGVDAWPAQKAFQEFFRASGSQELSADDWRKLAQHLKELRNAKAHKKNDA
jgi:transcriptional regulator with XRE-family HTH domain